MEVSPHDEERVKEPMADPNVARVLSYHQLSKHHLHRYAPSGCVLSTAGAVLGGPLFRGPGSHPSGRCFAQEQGHLAV